MAILRELGEDALNDVPGNVIDSNASIFELQDDGDNPTQPNSPQNSSIYTMACDESLMSRQVEQWMGSLSPTQTTGIQGSRPTLMQRSVLATDSEVLPGTIMWNILTLMMPLLNIADTSHWRSSQNAVSNLMDLMSYQMARACRRMQCNIGNLFHSHFSREILATAMDVLLLVYAIGFLVLSVYQAGIVPTNS